MIEEKFAAGHSVIHRLDPRLKIVVATVYSFVVALSERFPSLLAALAVAAALVALARLDLREVLRRLLPVNVLVLLLWIFMPLTFEGEPLFLIGPFPVSGAGAELAARITLKANAILPALMALVASESVAVLGHALDRLGAPPKMVHLLLLTYRYVFVLEQEYRRLATAMKLRCFRPGTNMHTYRTYAYLVGMLFVRA
jgi:cobalt/nickel transport system permease protein